MKRSVAASLALMGAAPLFLVACGQGGSPLRTDIAYDSAQTCAEDGNPLFDCQEAEKEAKARAEGNAPQFATENECNAQYENCERVTRGGNNWFVPAMVGFMVARSLNSGSGSALAGNTLYRNRGGALTRLSKVADGTAVSRPFRGQMASRGTLSGIRAAGRTGGRSGGFGGGRSYGG